MKQLALLAILALAACDNDDKFAVPVDNEVIVINETDHEPAPEGDERPR